MNRIFKKSNSTQNWSLDFCLPFQVGALFVMLFTLESPRWLISKERLEKAVEALNKINTANGRGKINETQFREMVAEQLKSERKENYFVAMSGAPRFFLVHAFAMFFVFAFVSFVTYTITINFESLTGSLFLNFTISA